MYFEFNSCLTASTFESSTIREWGNVEVRIFQDLRIERFSYIKLQKLESLNVTKFKSSKFGHLKIREIYKSEVFKVREFDRFI